MKRAAVVLGALAILVVLVLALGAVEQYLADHVLGPVGQVLVFGVGNAVLAGAGLWLLVRRVRRRRARSANPSRTAGS
ncbi:MAG TPA: hypothetical protein VGA02_05105 [Gemmatimonadales bacterium]